MNFKLNSKHNSVNYELNHRIQNDVSRQKRNDGIAAAFNNNCIGEEAKAIFLQKDCNNDERLFGMVTGWIKKRLKKGCPPLEPD